MPDRRAQPVHETRREARRVGWRGVVIPLATVILLSLVSSTAHAADIETDPCLNRGAAADQVLHDLDGVEGPFRPWPSGKPVDPGKDVAGAIDTLLRRARAALGARDACLARVDDEAAVMLQQARPDQADALFREAFGIAGASPDHRQLLWEVAQNVVQFEPGYLVLVVGRADASQPDVAAPPTGQQAGLADPILRPPPTIDPAVQAANAFRDEALTTARAIELQDGVDYEGVRAVTGLDARGTFVGPGAGALLLHNRAMFEIDSDDLSGVPLLAEALSIGDRTLPANGSERMGLHLDHARVLADIGELSGDKATLAKAEQELIETQTLESATGGDDLSGRVADVQEAEEKFSEARDAFRKALAAKPSDLPLMFGSVAAAFAAGDAAAAESELQNLSRAYLAAHAPGPAAYANSAQDFGAVETFLRITELQATLKLRSQGSAPPLVRAITERIARRNLLAVAYRIQMAGNYGADYPGGPIRAAVPERVKAVADEAHFDLAVRGDGPAAAMAYARAAELGAADGFGRWARLGAAAARLWTMAAGGTCPSVAELVGPGPPNPTLDKQAQQVQVACALLAARSPAETGSALRGMAGSRSTLLDSGDVARLAAGEVAAGARGPAFDMQFLATQMDGKYWSPGMETGTGRWSPAANTFQNRSGSERRQAIERMQQLVAMTFGQTDPAAAIQALETAWRVKDRGILLASISSQTPEALATTSALVEFVSALPSDPDRPQWRKLNQLMAAAHEAGQQGTPFPAVAPPDLTVSQAGQALGPSGALLEFVRYASPDAAVALGLPVPRRWNYAVAVLRQNETPVWRDLGSAEAIEAATRALRGAIDHAIDARRHRRRFDTAVTRSATERLYQLLIQPLLPDLAGVENLSIAPDGLLHLLPFAALQGPDGRYLAQSYQVSEVDSARDLAPSTTHPVSNSPVIFAAPDFGHDATTVCGGQGLWSALPDTAAEAAQVAGLLPGSRTVVGPAATKAALFEIHHPSILHIATHGYFCESAAGGSPAISATLDDPLLRAGLVFSGANRPAPENAGSIATAVEVSRLDLHGTSLVVLSACETGLGDIAVGEGVLGLRRALAEAGAESEVLTLWEVGFGAPDDFMSVFYQALKAGKSRAEAFHIAQLNLIGDPKFDQPFLWAGFTLYGRHGPVQLGN